MTPTRVPLALATALAFHVSMSPPATSDVGKSCDRRGMCTTARFVTILLTKGLFWAAAVTDTLVVLTPYVPALQSKLLSFSVPSAGTLLSWIQHPTRWGPDLAQALSHLASLSVPLPFVTPLPLMTVAGTTLALAGAYVRYAAFRGLGKFYGCRNQGTGPCVGRGKERGHAHVLITNGPYGVVRHPGYAGLATCTTGLVMLHLDALRASGVGSWDAVCGSAGMRAVALACAVVVSVGALCKIGGEERSLRARFNGEWDAWAARVPYKLVPGVY